MDTGATQTRVREDLVADDDILDGEVTIRCAHGDTASYPLTVVKISIGGKDIITTAAVSSTLPASVFLRWDVPKLMNFVVDERTTQGKADALAVMTRLRRRQQQETHDREPLNQEVEASPSTVRLSSDLEDADTNFMFNFDDLLFAPAGLLKPALTRAQKREN